MLKLKIETLSQNIGMLTGAVDAAPEDVEFWFKMKDGLVSEMIRITQELNLILIKKVVK